VSGAHLNPIVSIAFTLRSDFGWLRVRGYLVAQLAGALLASMVLRLTFGDLAHLGVDPARSRVQRRPSSSKQSSVSG
jgi:aquaporin Z